MPKRRTLIAASIMLMVGLLAATLAVVGARASGSASREATYLVTVTNLTDGQPLTPPLIATHRDRADLFDLGRRASFELKEIAENGNLAPMLELLDPETNRNVSDVETIARGATDPAPIVPQSNPGGTDFSSAQAFILTADGEAKYLSYVSMLICTNDGFTGVDSAPLPEKVGESVTLFRAGYDAGTELNTEDFVDIVPPCQGLIGVSSDDPGTGESNPDLAEGGVIHLHPGIEGGDDLDPSVHGWVDPVVMVFIERIDGAGDDRDDDD